MSCPLGLAQDSARPAAMLLARRTTNTSPTTATLPSAGLGRPATGRAGTNGPPGPQCVLAVIKAAGHPAPRGPDRLAGQPLRPRGPDPPPGCPWPFNPAILRACTSPPVSPTTRCSTPTPRSRLHPGRRGDGRDGTWPAARQSEGWANLPMPPICRRRILGSLKGGEHGRDSLRGGHAPVPPASQSRSHRLL
jgi:hypothetical protein